ncbi:MULTISPECIES: CsbD family protein [unclassified Bradyrhizobium]|uniref:CsbD family protein n=1 Tax=unclassified Bradyrhizobium TaxID=2631580 RepID=UPI001FF92C38|nr:MULTISPECIES: CsbD family protein [unclassified Bradyrhizobium]MCK1712414.1 CsbD family protein [Bradyrhizobium sp. 143]MCK1724903.1 CsbD family protein [Bradyrhizobium sp. 142]
MSKTKGVTQRIAGKAKQAIGEIIGDQDLHEQGKDEAERGREDLDKPSELNPLKKLKQLT